MSATKQRGGNGRTARNGSGAVMVGRKRIGPSKKVLATPAGKFGKRLQELADKKKLSADEFAERIGKSNQSVWKYFRGTHVPHINDWPVIAKALGFDNVQEFFAEFAID